MMENLCQIELQVPDLEKASEFYLRAFNWKAVPAMIHSYLVLQVPPDCPYGISLICNKTMPIDPQLAYLTLYFRVENKNEIAQRVVKNGGRIIKENKKLPGYGSLTIVSDPYGHQFGLID